MKIQPEILFQNETLLAVGKPSGMLSVPDRHNTAIASLYGWVTNRFPEARQLNRLDAYTSGVVLFSMEADSFGFYSDQFMNREVTKVYYAIVEGRVLENGGVIDAPLHTQSDGYVIVSKKGKPSQTNWELEEAFHEYSLIKAIPLTGRTHQIRVHMASIGHPIVGDVQYGGSPGLFLSTLKRNAYKQNKSEETERPLIGRMALHSFSIGIKNFKDNQSLHIECPFPKDMRVGLQKLRQFGSQSL